MLCVQCAQTDQGTGCTTVGVCSKTPEVAAMQDLLIDQVKRLSYYATRANLSDEELNSVGRFSAESLFATMTNVNFDAERFKSHVVDAVQRMEALSSRVSSPPPMGVHEGVTVGFESADEVSKKSVDELAHMGRAVGVDARKEHLKNIDVWSARELITYGVKGTAAYADHALELESEDPAVWKSLVASMDAISPFGGNLTDLGSLLGLALEVGGTNVRVMQMLDEAHTSFYGAMEPTQVHWGTKGGPGVLVSGHDLRDMYEICKAAEGRGVNVYTHGELLPAGSRPAIKNSSAYAGHYGGPWQLQRSEFAFFPGPIVLTTNCLMEPRKSYRDRLYTRGTVGFPGVTHLRDRSEFSRVIDHALRLPAIPEPKQGEAKRTLTTGFGHQAILGVADKVVEAVKAGAIKNFLLVGGCDGQASERSYFRDVALQAPKDSVVLTLACGKFRFNDQQAEMGEIGGIPRLLDMGQCNDSYGAVVVASALKDAFALESINDLPLSFYISWYEQKAAAVLLSLLHLNVQNIVLGPNLPAFISPNILNVLVDKFGIAPASTAEADMKRLLK